MNENNYNAYFVLSIIANLCQLADFQMNVSDIRNEDLMSELKIIENQNKEILKILKDK